MTKIYLRCSVCGELFFSKGVFTKHVKGCSSGAVAEVISEMVLEMGLDTADNKNSFENNRIKQEVKSGAD